ncbi:MULTISPECIES: sulfate adenylyltransferase [Campylobacter]|uniref:sulfate adenylyltransferase n=1 Tax=Campylobacter TaxID=194 RepID=UPI00147071B6|nr:MULTISPECIES: sulfate adenylyltransferase [Campylobacter]MBN7289184.1 sulfate adenylyltransferase [Campylobacter curvus]MDU6828389.1 sulfate adenylyltransferase [Campylobacter sp.]
MTSSRKNKSIIINTEVFGTLELIKNQVISNFSALMDDEQIRLVNESGYFEGEPMPYSFGFAPPSEMNQHMIKQLSAGERVNLVLEGRSVGHIDVGKIFKLDKFTREKNIFLANESANGRQLQLGEYAISGEFEIYDESIKDAKFRLKNVIKEINAKKITSVFLTADPFNRAHERLIRMTVDKADLVIVFLVRTLQENHIDYAIRKRVLEFFNQNYLPEKRVFVFPLENTTLFSSHTNPTLECIAARSFGANKLVIGQNHTGIGMFYDHNEAHTILDRYKNELAIEIIVLPELVYCNQCRTLVSTKTCPHGQHHHIKYHPDIIKELLFKGIMPPAILVRPEISAFVLSELFPNRFKDVQKLCDDLFVNSGLLEKRTDRDFYEELMKLYQTSSMT